MEISCDSGRCKVAEAFTPVNVTVNTNGHLAISAYSGCWEGAGKTLKSGKQMIIAASGMRWTSEQPNNMSRANFIVAIDASDQVGLIKGNGFAMPITCEQQVKSAK